ncbi:hypothetical protein AB8B23_06605 [Leptotrichia sp. HSP-342]|uniref:Uncharacterized protein n=1 Tax=Leptotrichia mesophila TaxID=3239303 RepID=A0AB39V8D7_9FUSO
MKKFILITVIIISAVSFAELSEEKQKVLDKYRKQAELERFNPKEVRVKLEDILSNKFQILPDVQTGRVTTSATANPLTRQQIVEKYRREARLQEDREKEEQARKAAKKPEFIYWGNENPEKFIKTDLGSVESVKLYLHYNPHRKAQLTERYIKIVGQE